VLAYADRTFGPAMRVSSYLGVPLVRADGELYGTLCGFGLERQPPSFTGHLAVVEHTARLLSTILAQEGAAVANQRLIERVIEDSERDVLTGLLNRRGWERALGVEESRCQRSGCSATVIVVDLDGLKTVNDSNGHAAGDAFLRRTAEVLRDSSRPSDVVARLGGDEFAVLVTTPADDLPDDREQWWERYVARLAGRLAAADCPASLGHAQRRDQDAFGQGLAAAWRRADEEMYAEKSAHRRTRSGNSRN
jgi:diguanylate cyclase (GGDEF)-like protein